MKISVDVFGGDNSPNSTISGSLLALDKDLSLSLVLVGDEDKIKSMIEKSEYLKRIEIINAPDVISCEDDPISAIRYKKESSMVVGLKATKQREDIDAFVSAGSTGALLTGAFLILKTIKGISRPALIPELPVLNPKLSKKVLLCDAGANTVCTAENLYDFTIMAKRYSQKILKVKKPVVGILSNGTEDSKGTDTIRAASNLIADINDIDFKGQVEARDALSGKFDIVVADGFSGNIFLKSVEGAAVGVLELIKDAIKNTTLKAKIGGLLIKTSVSSLKDKLDYTKGGGALFIGVQKPVIKAHGSSEAVSFCNSILQARDIINSKITEEIV